MRNNPSGFIADSKMCKTIFGEISLIDKDTGILAQIIIVDHVNGNKLKCKKSLKDKFVAIGETIMH